jgi:hypothetical protein
MILTFFFLWLKYFLSRKYRRHTKKTEGELIMIELTDSAKEQIDEYFNGKEPSPVRIFLNSGG